MTQEFRVDFKVENWLFFSGGLFIVSQVFIAVFINWYLFWFRQLFNYIDWGKQQQYLNIDVAAAKYKCCCCLL